MIRDRRENWISLLSFGFFIMLFALFFIVKGPSYGDTVVSFFKDFELQEVSENVFLPAPIPRPYHKVVYETVAQFCLFFGLFQISLLALRFYFGSSVSKTAETVSNIVFWLGAAYMFYLLMLGEVAWFPLFGGIIAVAGFSVIARSLVLLLFYRRRFEI